MTDDARRAFLTELIDDAGLFPPASLAMKEAVDAHVTARTGGEGWMLARFICPASRLTELAEVLPDDERPWRLSVLLDGTGGEPWLERMATDLATISAFLEEIGSRTVVELLETQLPVEADAHELRRFVEVVEGSRFPHPVTPFLEIAPAALPAPLEAIAEIRHETPVGGACLPPGAKLRCGGARPELFPQPETVAVVIDAARRLDIPLKATAGLHHPFRHLDRPTGFVQHGFVNIVGASILATTLDLPVDRITPIVAEEDPSAFSITAERLAWRDLVAAPADIAAARGARFLGYGSCSFDEPVDDLRALGVLPA